MIEAVLVPEDRVGVINKRVRNRISRELGISVRTEENTAFIDGEGLKFLQAKSIVVAIGRGFSPQRAFRLLDEEQELLVIEIGKHAERTRPRLIGTEGRTRKKIEEYTGAFMSVQDKTVSLIGNWKQLKHSKQAVEMILDGAKHSFVYKFLEEI